MVKFKQGKQRRTLLIQNVMKNEKIKYSNFLERIFSVKNEISIMKKYKVLTIFGMKIKFKRRNNA